MAIKCPKCHSENPETKQFCADCGTRLIPFAKDIYAGITETLQTPIKELTTGSTFAGRYQVIEELGKGGMGRVYKVFDTDIKEKIALKLLKPDIAADQETIERFSNELRYARKIRHKNVCGMYDLGKVEGTHFITMEYISGEDLKSMIRMTGSLTIGATLSIGKQVCDGLAEAHSLGVVHRDLKPQNIMIDKGGNAKIMDFGIARSIREKGITGPSVLIGTPEYMSPEQAEAKEVDHRTDIYSLGIILYEMATGRVPFEGDTALSVAMKHKGEVPQNPKLLNPNIPDDLSGVILKCLEKDKSQRYQNAADLRSELEKIEKGIPTTERVIPKRKVSTSRDITVKLSPRKLVLPTLAVAAVAVCAIVVYVRVIAPRRAARTPSPQHSTAASPSTNKRIVVLPFENQGAPEDEYFANGMTDEITARLGSISQLEVIAPASAKQYRKTEKSPQTIGEELGVNYILYGTVRWQKVPRGVSRVRVTPFLVRVSDATQLWANSYDQTIEEVFQVQADIAGRVAEALNIALLGRERRSLAATLTGNSEAYEYYLRGHDYMVRGADSKRDFTLAVEQFEKAIELDPGFAIAYAELAEANTSLYWYFFDRSEERAAKAKQAADRAMQISPELPEVHLALGLYYYQCQLDYRRALDEFALVQKEEPNKSSAYYYSGLVNRRQGKLGLAITNLKRALEIDPRSSQMVFNLGETCALARDREEAERFYDRAISLSPDYPRAYAWKARLHLNTEGDIEGARAILEQASQKVVSPDDGLIGYQWVLVEIFDGKYQKALDRLSITSSEAFDEQFYFVPKSLLLAQIYGLLGNKEKEKEYYAATHTDLLKRIHERPDDSRFHSALGITCAGLGLKEQAIREAEKGVELLPVSKEFYRGIFRVKDLAQVYVMVGEYEKALDQIKYLLSMPGELSVSLLRIDPVWTPLRGLARFQRLGER